MSRENVELIRRAYDEAYRSRSVESLRDRVAEGFQFHARRGFLGRPTYRLDEVPQLWADLDETFRDYVLAPTDFDAIGDYVLVTIEQSARMKESDFRVDTTVWHLWHITDGKVREGWVFDDRKDALDTANRQ